MFKVNNRDTRKTPNDNIYNCNIIKANNNFFWKVRVRLEAGEMKNRSLSGNSFW